MYLSNRKTWELALRVKDFAIYKSLSQARNLFAALLMLPSCATLRFEQLMLPLKRAWNVSKPKYPVFYQVTPLLTAFQQEPLPHTEDQVRLRCILLLRLLGLFRGVDLARAQRPLDSSGQPWFLTTKRKGRLYFAQYPVHHFDPVACDPQYWLAKYVNMTSTYAGNALFVSLTSARTPLQADTINGLTTRFLSANGLTTFTAHSTRGAAATSLLSQGVEPALVQSLGDWECPKTFNKFYNRLRATQPVAQCLIQRPEPRAGGPGGLPLPLSPPASPS
jgi:integrase